MDIDIERIGGRQVFVSIIAVKGHARNGNQLFGCCRQGLNGVIAGDVLGKLDLLGVGVYILDLALDDPASVEGHVLLDPVLVKVPPVLRLEAVACHLAVFIQDVLLGRIPAGQDITIPDGLDQHIGGT